MARKCDRETFSSKTVQCSECEVCPYHDKNVMQIRHIDLGVFQGCVGEETYWYPFTQTPTLGICPVSKQRAQKFVRDLCDINPGYTLDQFIIEPLDLPLFDAMQSLMRNT